MAIHIVQYALLDSCCNILRNTFSRAGILIPTLYPPQVQKLSRNVKDDVTKQLAKAEGANRRSVIEQVHACVSRRRRRALMHERMRRAYSRSMRETHASWLSKRPCRSCTQSVYRELVMMLDSGVADKSPLHPRNLKKGQEHVVMFVGLQVRNRPHHCPASSAHHHAGVQPSGPEALC